MIKNISVNFADNDFDFENINSLVLALSHWLWPLLCFFILIYFRNEIKSILKKIPKINKFKLGDYQFETEITEAEVKIKETTKITEEVNENLNIKNPSFETEENYFLNEYKNSPQIAILKLSIEIEKEVKKTCGTLGLSKIGGRISAKNSLEMLGNKGILSKSILSSVNAFINLRNEVVHEYFVEVPDTVRIFDMGISLLRAIKSIPHEDIKIHQIGIDIFSDENCSVMREDVKGIILQHTSHGGMEKTYRIYPTTNQNYYKVGENVAWEWNDEKSWGDSWYIDNEGKKLAWNGSLEFIGRHIKDI